MFMFPLKNLARKGLIKLIHIGKKGPQSLVQIMACRLFGAKLLSELMLEYC